MNNTETNIEVRDCSYKHCINNFVPYKDDQLYCSPACYKKGNAELILDKKRQKYVVQKSVKELLNKIPTVGLQPFYKAE